MKTYRIEFASSITTMPITTEVQVEDFENEQDAFDKLVDILEAEGNSGCFVTHDDIKEFNIYEDEYTIGGNHGLMLHHRGMLNIHHIV